MALPLPSRTRLRILAIFAGCGALSGLLFDQTTLTPSFVPLVFLVLLPFFLLPPGSSGQAFRDGALFGLASNLIGLRWLLVTMESYGHIPGGLAFAGLLLLSAYLSLFPALFRVALFRTGCWQGTGTGTRLAGRILLAGPALWIVTEAGKTEILTGFPWNPLGSLFFGHPLLAGPARVTGSTGLSFGIVAVTALIALSFDRWRAGVGSSRASAAAFGTAALFLLLAWPLWGWFLRSAPPAGPFLRVAMIQGNIPPDQKWTRTDLEHNLGRYLALSREEIGKGAALVVWPETALQTLYTSPLPRISLALKELLGSGTRLITGSVGEVPAPDAPMGVAFTNAAVLIGPRGTVQADYVKQHLVPFGEYLPLPALFGWLRPLLGSGGDMARASLPGDFPLGGGISATPVICYEALYPSLVRKSLANGSGLLVVVSDDAWFGATSAPYQLFRESAMRAIENGVPMVRAANTGISGAVSPDGQILVSGPLFHEASLSTEVPGTAPGTFYRRHGEWVLKLSLLGLFFWRAIAGTLVGCRPPR